MRFNSRERPADMDEEFDVTLTRRELYLIAAISGAAAGLGPNRAALNEMGGKIGTYFGFRNHWEEPRRRLNLDIMDMGKIFVGEK